MAEYTAISNPEPPDFELFAWFQYFNSDGFRHCIGLLRKLSCNNFIKVSISFILVPRLREPDVMKLLIQFNHHCTYSFYYHNYETFKKRIREIIGII